MADGQMPQDLMGDCSRKLEHGTSTNPSAHPLGYMRISTPGRMPYVLVNAEWLSFRHFEREFLEHLDHPNLAGLG
ncbi:MAG: hypothetical protein ACLPYZ_16395 [Limisphaerales bacterium]